VLAAPANVVAVHLTRLLPDGSDRERGDKAKIMLGSALGLPIIVAPPNDLLGLTICEGIEDALSVHQMTGLGAWAAGNASRLPALTDAVPDYIECITISEDDDVAGERNAAELAARLRARGFDVARIRAGR